MSISIAVLCGHSGCTYMGIVTQHSQRIKERSVLPRCGDAAPIDSEQK